MRKRLSSGTRTQSHNDLVSKRQVYDGGLWCAGGRGGGAGMA